MIDVFKATKIACRHAYSKLQIQLESYQNGKWADKNTSKQFLWIKLEWKYYFLVEVIEEKKRETLVTWHKLTFAAKSL